MAKRAKKKPVGHPRRVVDKKASIVRPDEPDAQELDREIEAEMGSAEEMGIAAAEGLAERYGHPTPAEAAQDAAVGESLAPEPTTTGSVAIDHAVPTTAGKFAAGEAFNDAGMLARAEALRIMQPDDMGIPNVMITVSIARDIAPPVQALEVDAGPLSSADRRLIGRLESAHAEDAREVADLQERHAQARTAAAFEEGMEIGGARWLTCTTCGGLVLPGAACPTDGQVAPS